MYQTRSERTGLGIWETLEEAMNAAEKDLSIWKISFTAENGERIRLIKDEGTADGVIWLLDPIYTDPKRKD